MVRIASSDRNVIILEERVPLPKDQLVSLNWWNPLYKGITNIRDVTLQKFSIQSLQVLKDLQVYSIKTRIAHEQINEDWIKIVIDGEDYIDEFGLYVYSSSIVVHNDAQVLDDDYRYPPNPFDKSIRELFKLEYAEYDKPCKTT